MKTPEKAIEEIKSFIISILVEAAEKDRSNEYDGGYLDAANEICKGIQLIISKYESE